MLVDIELIEEMKGALAKLKGIRNKYLHERPVDGGTRSGTQ